MGLALTLGLLAVLLGAVQCSPVQSLNLLHSLHRRDDSCRKCEEHITPQMENLYRNLSQLSQASVFDGLCRDLEPLVDCMQRQCDPKRAEIELAVVNYVCSNTEGAAAVVQCLEVEGEGLEAAGKSCAEETNAVMYRISSTLTWKEQRCMMASLIGQCLGRRVSRCPSPAAVDFFAPVTQLVLKLTDCE